MIHWKIEEPVFKVCLEFFTQCPEDKFIKYIKDRVDDFKDAEVHGSQGRYLSDNKHCVLWINSELTVPESIAVISHELIHHIFTVLGYRNIPINIDNDEVFAYLHECFLREIIKKFMACKKRKGKKK